MRLSLLVVSCLLCFAQTPHAAQPLPGSDGQILGLDSPLPIPGSYIVVLKRGSEIPPAAVPSLSLQIATKYGLTPRRIYSNLVPGFSVQANPAEAAQLAVDPNVQYVSLDHWVHAASTQSGAPYHLDRIDQRNLPLNGTYVYERDGALVDVYVLDTGVRHTHQQYNGRANLLWDAFGGSQSAYCPPPPPVESDPTPPPGELEPDGADDAGHGTHVSGIVGSLTYGVAKSVKLWDVRALNCRGGGQWSDVRMGLDQVAGHRPSAQSPTKVVNLSLGGPTDEDTDIVVAELARPKQENNAVVIVAAGNDNVDACSSSPARVPEAITVAASTPNDARWNTYTRAARSASNFGTCVDLFAPGQEVISTYSSSDTATKVFSGTSMATPLVSGVAAMYLDSLFAAGNLNVTSDHVAQTILGQATPGKIRDPGVGSPNLLLYNWMNTAAPPPAGTLSFSSPTYTSPETGSISITVKRVGGSSGVVSAQYQVTDGSATAPADYSPPTGTTLTWASGDASDKQFSITINPDTQDEADETVNLKLINPMGGAVLGTPSTAQLIILDDDNPPEGEECPYQDPDTGIWTYCQ